MFHDWFDTVIAVAWLALMIVLLMSVPGTKLDPDDLDKTGGW